MELLSTLYYIRVEVPDWSTCPCSGPLGVSALVVLLHFLVNTFDIHRDQCRSHRLHVEVMCQYFVLQN